MQIVKVVLISHVTDKNLHFDLSSTFPLTTNVRKERRKILCDSQASSRKEACVAKCDFLVGGRGIGGNTTTEGDSLYQLLT